MSAALLAILAWLTEPTPELGGSGGGGGSLIHPAELLRPVASDG